MRCVYCAAKAGILKKICATCGSVVAVVEQSAGQLGWTGLVDHFVSTGLTQVQVDRVLDAEIDGRPALRDRLTSEMANVLMRGLGMPGRQSPEDVQRIRRGVKEDSGA